MMACVLNCGSICVSDSTLPRLTDTKAVEAFVDSAEVVVIGFLEVRQENFILREKLSTMGSNKLSDIFQTYPLELFYGAVYYCDTHAANQT